MELFDVRAKFVKLSGRRDLMDEYGFDQGADYFINAGSRMLNSMVSDTVPTDNILLEDDKDENFWSREHPDVLIHAALYRLEIGYRNSSGARDWLSSIGIDLVEIDKEYVEEQAANVTEMEG